MEIEKSKVSIQFLLIFRQSGDVFFFLYARRLRGYTATVAQHWGFVSMVRQHRIKMFLFEMKKNISFRIAVKITVLATASYHFG